MTAIDQNFTIYAGDTKNVIILVTDEYTGDITNLSGSDVNWVLYDPVWDEVLLTKTTVSGVLLSAPTLGEMTVQLAPADTEAIRPANWYIHEAEITDALGNVTTVTLGYVTVKKSKA